MAERKEVFQSKVLQKLYPAVPKPGKVPSPPRTVEALANKTYVTRNACQASVGGDAGQTHGSAKAGRRVYTVLPPPADYMRHSEKSSTLTDLENGDGAKDPSEETACANNDELKRDGESRQGKRRKRKHKSTVHQKPAQDAAAPTGERDAPIDQGGEGVSRNRRRKLKKKRHKEKLLSTGVTPRASALEFTYQKDGEMEEEKEDAERRAAELSDFLRTTLETYISDASVHTEQLPVNSKTVENLVSSISSGCKPTSVLQQLCLLKVYVEEKDTDKLEKALKALYSNSFMSEEETTAVNSLFQYWITDILPMQRDQTVRR